MFRALLLLPFALTISLFFTSEATHAECIVEGLRCEYLIDPMGIDEIQPRLSWVIRSDDRAQIQTAYQILVADSAQALAENRASFWDSGKVASGNSTAVVYAGNSLDSGQRFFWKVRVWDKHGNPSGWSSPAKWSTGLLHPGDWQAEWIGYDAERGVVAREAPFAGSSWICDAENDLKKVPAGDQYFVKRFEIPEGVEIENAELLAIADDQLWVSCNGQFVISAETGWKKVKPFDATEVLQTGQNEIRVRLKNGSVGPAGMLLRLEITLDDKKQLVVVSDGSWMTGDLDIDYWPYQKLDNTKLKACRVIGEYGCQPWGKCELQELFLPPVSRLRTEFQVEKPIAMATLYVLALGNCNASLNGAIVSEEFFTPGWTDYTKRVYYRSYDVTPMLRSGKNALGVELADGWFSGYIGWGRNRNHYGKNPRAKVQLNIQYADGTSAVVGTDPNWKATAGPTREADFLMGETFDAIAAQPDWCTSQYDAHAWSDVDVGAKVEPILEPHPGPPVVAIEEFQPVAITEPRPGTYIFDLGQYIAGVARLKVKGKQGQIIKLRFGERLQSDGTLYTANLRGARTLDTYICRGSGVETWLPRFTFHGFQYVEVTGLDREPADDTITGIALSSKTPRAGSFACSDDQLNRLYKNVLWTQYANFIDVPTDCPQRDERLGWTGDAQVYVATACLNTDVHAFFRKWLVDLVDAQRDDGQFPMVAPLKVAGDDGGPAWADAGVICPWTIYKTYGDQRLLEKHYPSMRRYVDFCRNRSQENLLPPEKYHCFGDWLSIGADTPKDIIYTAYFAHCTRLLAQAAEVLGKRQDAKEYYALFQEIKSAFNNAYVDEQGRILGDTQCCYVLALAYDLVDGERKKQAADYLVEKIADRDYHLSTGFVGTKDLMLVLSAIGRNDIAYRLIHNDTFPSWGFSIKHGATSIWERWDGWTPKKGFQDPGMNSFAHYSFGAVYQWMVENIGGIRSLEPGYKRIEIAPQPDGKLKWAKTDYHSIYGRIASHWRIENDKLHLAVTIPPNTSAQVRLPQSLPSHIKEGGYALAESPGIKDVRKDSADTVIELGSGSYSFVTKHGD